MDETDSRPFPALATFGLLAVLVAVAAAVFAYWWSSIPPEFPPSSPLAGLPPRPVPSSEEETSSFETTSAEGSIEATWGLEPTAAAEPTVTIVAADPSLWASAGATVTPTAPPGGLPWRPSSPSGPWAPLPSYVPPTQPSSPPLPPPPPSTSPSPDPAATPPPVPEPEPEPEPERPGHGHGWGWGLFR